MAKTSLSPELRQQFPYLDTSRFPETGILFCFQRGFNPANSSDQRPVCFNFTHPANAETPKPFIPVEIKVGYTQQSSPDSTIITIRPNPNGQLSCVNCLSANRQSNCRQPARVEAAPALMAVKRFK